MALQRLSVCRAQLAAIKTLLDNRLVSIVRWDNSKAAVAEQLARTVCKEVLPMRAELCSAPIVLKELIRQVLDSRCALCAGLALPISRAD